MRIHREGRRSGSHTAASTKRDSGTPDIAGAGDLDSYLAALAPDPGETASELTGRFGSAQVFQLRLPALRIEQLRRLAAERGVSPGSLAVDWVIDRLDREDTPTGPFAAVEEEQAPRRRGPLGRLGLR